MLTPEERAEMSTLTDCDFCDHMQALRRALDSDAERARLLAEAIGELLVRGRKLESASYPGHYISTACQTGNHKHCRLNNKWSNEPCQCECGHPGCGAPPPTYAELGRLLKIQSAEMSELRESLAEKDAEIERLRSELATSDSDRLLRLFDSLGVECGNCSTKIIARGGSLGEHHGLTPRLDGEDLQICGYCAGLELVDQLSDVATAQHQLTEAQESRDAWQAQCIRQTEALEEAERALELCCDNQCPAPGAFATIRKAPGKS